MPLWWRGKCGQTCQCGEKKQALTEFTGIVEDVVVGGKGTGE